MWLLCEELLIEIRSFETEISDSTAKMDRLQQKFG